MIIKNHLRKKGFALGLALKQRLAASLKWPVVRYSLEGGTHLQLLEASIFRFVLEDSRLKFEFFICRHFVTQ